MEEPVVEQINSNKDEHKLITVKVNNHQVQFHERKVTGLEIKETAIQQGVAIQADFNLFRVKSAGHLDPISDNESIELKEGEEFRATAPDESS